MKWIWWTNNDTKEINLLINTSNIEAIYRKDDKTVIQYVSGNTATVEDSIEVVWKEIKLKEE